MGIFCGDEADLHGGVGEGGLVLGGCEGERGDSTTCEGHKVDTMPCPITTNYLIEELHFLTWLIFNGNADRFLTKGDVHGHGDAKHQDKYCYFQHGAYINMLIIFHVEDE